MIKYQLYEKIRIQKTSEDVEQIYSLNGIYNNITKEVVVGWKRNKVTSDKSFDVRYAFSSFHKSSGFYQHGTPAPNGTGVLLYSSSTPNGYNGIEYRGSIKVEGRDFIYMAIKHENSLYKFREIKFPITRKVYPAINFL